MQFDRLYHADCLARLGDLPAESVHALITDIPYGIGAEDWDVLHANTNSAYLGASPAQAKANGAFKRRGKPLNGWSAADREIGKEYETWCAEWLQLAYPALKPGASVLLFAGRRFSHRLMVALEDSGYTIKDQIAWIKPQALHRAQRLSVVYEKRADEASAEEWQGWRLGNLRPRFEPIIWATKPYKIGTTIADNVLRYGVGAYNPDALERFSRDSANIFEVGMHRNEAKVHPTQKPLALMSALVELVTKEEQVVLDPFAGSATTLVAAKAVGRRFIGFERERAYYEAATERLNATDPARLF
ncbi:Modification methylase HindIII [Nostocoides jenkinsii Ben 74]|uniref:Methyltransferase n=2 Tax=Nostocoides jenkinsii TaxID=330834 RepID=A0A077M8H0_9MICO|nr:Modification methylase HindIII [Tetrasphaera jenkinsii Ben 74]